MVIRDTDVRWEVTMEARAQLFALVFGPLPSSPADVDRFREQFEQVFTYELDKSALTGRELIALQSLFDVVVWYSPIAPDRDVVPHYRDEREVVEAIRLAQQGLRATAATSEV